ncbi:MAG: autotransporter-associated beta strand repeat-containing protein [Chthoniobacteraceae bacterium]
MRQLPTARSARRKLSRALNRLKRFKRPAFILSTAIAMVLPHMGKADTFFWDPAGNQSNSGGAGIWNTTSLFWNDDFLAPNVPWANSVATPNSAFFSGTGGTITLGSPIVVNLMQFTVPGYQLAAGGNNSLTLAGPGAGFLLSSGTMNLSLPILGTDGLFKDGAGTLALTNLVNTYSGVTRIFDGVVEITNITNLAQPSSLGIGGPALDMFGLPSTVAYLEVDGGTFRYTGTGASTNRTFSISSRGGTLDSSGTGASLGFSITSAGVKTPLTGARALTLTGTNIGLNNIAAPIGDADGSSPTSLIKSGTGTWSMTAPNTYNGSTTLRGGILQISTINNGGAPSNLGQGSNDPRNLVFDGGTLRYVGVAAPSDRAFTLGPGGGAILSNGTGAMNLTNNGLAVASGTGPRTLTLGGSAVGNILHQSLADPATVYALNTSNQLLRFQPGSPETIEATYSFPATGTGSLQTGELLHGLDFRTSNGKLYAMGTTGSSPVGSVNRIYEVTIPASGNTATATLIATVSGLTLTGGNPGAANAAYGFDFDPTNDNIRVVGADRQNIQINASAYTSFTAGTALTGGSRVVGAAYSNNVIGAMSTTLYGIDSTSDSVVTINPATGQVTPVGLLNGGAFAVAAGDNIGFDIGSNGAAYASIQDGSAYRFYDINLGNGIATLLGNILIGTTPIRDISVAINGTTSLVKTGAGTWTIDRSGTSSGGTYTGTTTIQQGTLTLNFNQTQTPNLNLLSANSPLIMGGGTLAITGKASTANSQTFKGLTLLPGGSAFTAAPGGSGSVTVNLGALSTRPTAATVAFPSSATVNLTASNDATGILGAWATHGGSDWAVVNAGVVGAYTGYIDLAQGGVIANGPTSHVRLNTTGGSGNVSLGATVTTINTLNQNLSTAATVGTTGGTLRLAAVGGVLVGTGLGSLTIGTTAANVGILTAGGTDNTPGELILHNNSSNLLTINSIIANNGSGAVTVENAGTGVTVLNGPNTYTGGTILNAGTLRIGDNRSLSTGAITVNGSTTAPILASSSGIGREIINDLILNSDVAFVDATGTGGFVLRGNINLTGGARAITVNTANGYVTLSGTIMNGSLVKSGLGALALLGTSVSGVTDITLDQGSLDLWSPTAAGSALIFASSGSLSASGAFYAPVMNTIFAGENLSLGRTQVSDGIDLGGLIDLSNSTIISPRVITVAGAQPQQQQRISGTIVSGALSKSGLSDLYITTANSTYEGGTIVAQGSLRLTPTGRLGANAAGNDIYVMQDPNLPGTTVTANTFGILRIESLANVGSNQGVYLNNFTATATPMLGWGPAFDANPDALGFVDYFDINVAPSDTGLGFIRVYSDPLIGTPGPVAIVLDGIRSSFDVIGKVNSGSANLVDVWLGATPLNGTFTGASLAPSASQIYHFGGGGGTLTIERANVLTGLTSLVTGSFDNVARGITGVVFIPKPQDFTGSVTVGSGTTLVVGQDAALGTGTDPITLANGTLNLRTSGYHSTTDTQYAGRTFRFIASSTITIDPLGGGQNGRVQIGALDFSSVVAAPTFTANITNSFDLRVIGPITLLSAAPATPNNNLTTTFTVNSGFVTLEVPVDQTFPFGTGVANFTKAGGGTVIMTQPGSYGGTTTVNGGTLVLTNPNAVSLGPVNLQSGTLSLRSDAGTPTLFNFQAGPTISDFNLTGSAATLYVGPIAPTGIAAYTGTPILVPNLNAGTQTGLTVTGQLGASLRVVGQLTMGANFTLTVNAARTELFGGVAGNFNLTKAGIGTLTLSNVNISTGNTVIAQGTVVANGAATGIVNTFGSGTLSFAGTLSGGVLIAGNRTLAKAVELNSNGGTQVLGGFDAGAKIFSGNIVITSNGDPNTGSPNNSGVVLTADPGGDVSFTGTISGGVGGSVTIGSGSGNVLIPIAGTPALGRGSVIFAPATGTGNTFTLPVVLNNGTLIGQAQATSGSPFGNSTNAITLNQGTLQLNGRGASTTTTNGALTIIGGAQLILNDPNDAFTTTFAVASLTRAGIGALTYIPSGNTGQEIFNVGSGPAPVNGILPPWIVRATSSANGAGDFVALSGGASGSLVTATYSGSGSIDSALVNQVFNVTTGSPLTASRAVYAFKTATTLSLGAFTLRVGDGFTTGANSSGGIILNGGAGISSGVLDFGQSEGVIYVAGAATSAISSAITGAVLPEVRTAANVNNGSSIITGLPDTGRLAPGMQVTGTGVNAFIAAVLSPTSIQLTANATATNTDVNLTFIGSASVNKIGDGTLVLSGANNYRGATVVNRGTLRMGATNALGRWTLAGAQFATGLTISANGTLELNGFDTEAGSLAGSFGAVVNLGGNRLTVGRNNANTTYSGQLLGLGGSTLQKLGAGTLTLDNTRADANATTFAGSILLDQGGLTVVVADGTNGSPFATGNSLPAGLTFTLRGGVLNLRSSGDNTTGGQVLVGGYHLVVTGANSTLSTDRFSTSESNISVELNTLTLGRNSFTVNNANTIVPKVMGTTTLTDSALIIGNQEIVLDGVVTDNGAGYTLVKQGGGNFFVNNPNNNYSGGTVVVGGNLFFGARATDPIRFTGNAFVPNEEARAGTGPIVLETNTIINLNDSSNLAPGQTVRLLSSVLSAGSSSGFVIQSDRPVADYNLRALGRGSLQLGINGGHLNATGDGTYTTALDMSKIGDGQWGLTTGRSVETLYIPSTLGAGSGNVFRFYGSSGAALVLTESNVLTGTATVELGRPLTDLGANPGNSNASIRLQLGQNYSGNTLIHRAANAAGASAALLDFRGTLASPTLEVYGRLFATGAGTFTNAAGAQVNNVVLRPGGELRLDYNNNTSNATSFLVPLGTTSATGFTNKWADTQPIVIDGATLRVSSASGSLSTEIIGAVTYKGGAEIFPESIGTGGNSVVIINGALTRVNLGTLAFRSASGQLGVSGEPGTNAGQRIVFGTPAQAAASGVARQVVASGPAIGTVVSMVPPRFFSNTANTFVDYAPNTVLGFSDVPFRTVNAATFNASGANNGTEIIDHVTTDATTIGAGIDIWALKTNVEIGDRTTTNSITIRSGGLAVTDAGTVYAPLLFRNGATTQEADIWAITGTVVLRGTVTAQNLVKTGAGTLVISANNTGTLMGTIQVNGGTLVLGGANPNPVVGQPDIIISAAQALGSATDLRLHAGNFNNAGNQMPQVNLLSNTAATYNQSITISEFVPFATINVDRVSTTGTNQGLTVSGNLTIEGGGSDGTVLAFTNGNDFDFTSSGVTTFGLPGNTARIGISVTNNNGTNNVTFSGRVTGPAPVVKTGNGPLILRYTNAANPQNDFTGGLTLNAGTLQLRNDTATTALTIAGTGSAAGIVINGGTLQLISDTTNTNFASNSGNSLTIRGQAVVQIDRVGANTPLLILGGDTATFTTQNSPNIHIQTASGTVTGGVWAGKTVIHDSPTFNLASTSFQLGNAAGGDSISGSGHIYKTGNNALIFNSGGANNFTGGLDIFQGQVRAITATDTFGTGAIRISPAGVLGVFNAANVTSNLQVANFHSNSTALAGIAIRFNGLAATSFLDASRITTAAGNGGLLAIDTTVTNVNPINMGTLYDGNWFLGSTSGGTYQAALTVGADSTYRLGGGGNTLTLSTTQNILTGATKALFGKPNALAGNGTVVINISNNYTGGTTISRVRDVAGNFTVSQVNIQQGFNLAPLGSGAVDVFGNFQIESGAGSAVSNISGNRNAFTFHPGARLIISNTTNYGGLSGTAGRWDDAAAIALRSSGLEMLASTSGGNQYNSETVGAVSFAGGSELRAVRGSTTSDVQLIINGTLTRVGTGTLTVNHTAGALGINSFASGVGAEGINVNNTTGLIDANGMVKPFIVSRADSQFLKYDPSLGLQTVTQTTPLADYIGTTTTTLDAGISTKLTNGTAILSYDSTTAATLGANLDLWALRTQGDINPSANNQFNQITIRSGGLTNYTGTARTINVNLIFGTAATPAEALIHASASNLTINSLITASNITVFGTNGVTINQDQTNFTGTWNVNQGQLIVQTPGALNGRPVNLNGWTGNTGQTQTELRFNHNAGTPDELTFTTGKITATDLNIIRAQTASDRTMRIGAIDLRTTNAVPGTGVPGVIRFQVDASRSLLRTGTITTFDDYVMHVDATSFGPGSTSGVQPDAINNQGSFNLTKLGDGVLILGNNSTTFTGSKTFTVNEGAVKVLTNGSLGAATTTAIIDNGGALEIATPGFTPTGTLIQRSGSIERWSVPGARSGNVTLPAGAHLQIAANQTATQTINLNGGSIMGYVPLDVDENAIFYTLGGNVSVNVVSDSMLGQPYPSGTNLTNNGVNHVYYDMGKQNQPNNPTNPQIFGAVLDIRGTISGATGSETLTKVGLDLIQLSGNNNVNNGFNTNVREGTLVLGSANALPATKALTVSGSGTLDLNGFNATTASLAGSSPFSLIANSAVTTNTLTVAGGTSYAGGLSGNLEFRKTGAADFTLSGPLSHSGPTTAMTGKLILTANATGTTTYRANGGATLDVAGVSGGLQLQPGQKLAGGSGATAGLVQGAVTALTGSSIAPGMDPGQFGILSLDSGLAFQAGSHLQLELTPNNTPGIGFDQVLITGGNITLGGADFGGSTVSGGPFTENAAYYIVLNTGAGTTTGTFAGVPQMAWFDIAGQTFQVNYTADFGGPGGATSMTGNDVALIAVPEPGSLVALCAGLGTLLGLGRFRRRA